MTVVAPDSATPATSASAEQRRNTWLLGLDLAIFAMLLTLGAGARAPARPVRSA